MDRRRFLLTSLAGVLTVSLGAEAQQGAKVFKVGELSPGTGSEERLAALREVGYVEGQNLVVERRYAEGRIERLPALAAELVGLKPDVILATGGDAIRAAMNATKIIPIVMAFGEDPVGKGLVASLARPGGNITGVSLVAEGTMAAKRVEIFKEAVPRAPIGLLSWPRMEAAQAKEADQAARALKTETIFVEVRTATMRARSLRWPWSVPTPCSSCRIRFSIVTGSASSPWRLDTGCQPSTSGGNPPRTGAS